MDNTDKQIFRNEINKDHYRVTIFGSARIKKDDECYKHVFDLAKEIGKNNIDIVTGGGPGLMEAASAGHHAGRKNKVNHTLGLNITLPHEQKPNGHLDIKLQFDKFSERLDSFVKLSNVIVVAPGGVGTALEFFYVWQLVQVKHSQKIPIIMMGDMWKDMIDWIKKWPLENKFLKKEDLDYIYIVNNNIEAIEIILEYYQSFIQSQSL